METVLMAGFPLKKSMETGFVSLFFEKLCRNRTKGPSSTLGQAPMHSLLADSKDFAVW